jgi:hypothetical protein
VAEMFISRDVANVLRQLHTDVQLAARQSDLWTYLADRRRAVEVALKEVTRLAKKDLRI